MCVQMTARQDIPSDSTFGSLLSRHKVGNALKEKAKIICHVSHNCLMHLEAYCRDIRL